MATNDYASMPTGSGNPMGMEEEPAAEPVPCLHVYKMADGTFAVKQDEAAPPPDAEPVGSLQEVIAMLEGLGADEAAEGEAMQAAKTGYAKRAGRPQMMAPGGIFGE